MAAGVEQLGEQARQPRDFLNGQVDAFGELGVVQLVAQVAQRHLDAGERVAQLVRHRGGELAGRGQAFGARQDALLLEQLAGGGAHLGFE